MPKYDIRVQINLEAKTWNLTAKPRRKPLVGRWLTWSINTMSASKTSTLLNTKKRRNEYATNGRNKERNRKGLCPERD